MWARGGTGAKDTKDSEMIAFIVMVEVVLVLAAFAAVYGLTRYRNRPLWLEERRAPDTRADPDDRRPRTPGR